MLRLFAILFVFLGSSSAMAETLQPRQIVSKIAEQIEANYFDAVRAKQIGRDLRKKADTGAYDSFKERLSLASALTEALKPYDAHFRVSLAEKKDGKPTRLYDFGERIKRSGYGIRSTSILPANIGYIEMNFFAHIDFQDPNDPAKNAIDAALSLTRATDALVIDLRRNGGGSPHMVGYLTSAFTSPDANIYNQFQTRSESFSEKPDTMYDNPDLEKPLYILIGGGTGSAAEALPYTLQAAKRATIVGERSYGAANPGGEIDVGDGFVVFISNGSPVNPITQSNWEGDGVQPDIAVDADQALHVAQLDALDHIAKTINAAHRQDIQWVREALETKNSSMHDQDLTPFGGSYGTYEIMVRDSYLELAQGRRPRQKLIAIGPDLFFNEIDPQTRFQFIRNDKNEIISLESLYSDGSKSRADRK